MAETTQTLWNLAFKLQLDWPSSDARSELSSLVTKVESLPDSDCEKRLLRGFLAYNFSAHATASVDIESDFKSVLTTDPTNTTARLYLGHFYFDSRKYQLAIEQLERIDIQEYLSAGQTWRALKIRELIIASRIHCDQLHESVRCLEQLVLDLMQEHPENIAVPVELVSSLYEQRSTLCSVLGGERATNIANDLRMIVDRTASSDVLTKEIHGIAGGI
ncbi:MAG: hypothetical protein H6822_03880 [Planctomycetaceae bacterium]|nr:hypothetical protein [Planctomycetales bacterium]MCB9921296.1 hypothetical protein [Planctomycetaceae bacterium]